MKQLRLLKMICTPVFVIDDGETLVEIAGNPVTLTEVEIEEFPERWQRDYAVLKEELT